MTDESPMSQHPTSFTTPSSPPSPRPSLSCSNSSYTSFANRQGFDRYGDDWGPDALTLLGELFAVVSLERTQLTTWSRCRRDLLRFVQPPPISHRFRLISRRLPTRPLQPPIESSVSPPQITGCRAPTSRAAYARRQRYPPD